MGTTYSVQYQTSTGEVSVDSLRAEIETELANVNLEMSTYVPSSQISQFNQSESTDWFTVSQAFSVLCEKARELSLASDGQYDVTVGPLVNLWGFGPQPRTGKPPSEEAIRRTLEHCGFHKLDVDTTQSQIRKQDPQLYVDLSSIAKGHGVDRLADLLTQHNVESFFIEIGGEIRAMGKKSPGKNWIAGIEAPREQDSSLYQALPLENESLASSGNYRNFFDDPESGQRYAHTIDPRTGYPAETRIAQASVISDLCSTADGIATVMMTFEQADQAIAIANKNDWSVLLLAWEGQQLKEYKSTGWETREEWWKDQEINQDE